MQPTARHPGTPPAPVSAAATAALAVATEYCSPALLNHSVRSYLWAAEYARRQGIEVDHELLYVAAVLHDLGLAAPFDSHRVEFEHAGGHVAWVFAAGAGWPAARRRRVAEVIVAHMADAVDPDVDPEGHVLEAATAFDISGRDIGRKGAGPKRWAQCLRYVKRSRAASMTINSSEPIFGQKMAQGHFRRECGRPSGRLHPARACR